MRFPVPKLMGGYLLSNYSMSFNFTVTVHLSGKLSLAELESALARLGRRHPLVRARAVAGEDGGVFLTDEGVPPVPVDVVPRVSENTWIKEVDRVLLVRPDYKTGPLYRCVWVKGEELSDLVLVTDHSTADGRAAVFAMRDLLTLLADPALELEPIAPVRQIEVWPAPIKQKLEEMLAALKPEESTDDGDGPPLSDDPRTLTPFTLTEAETSALAERSRAEGVSVQAALCAAFLKPFAEGEPEIPVRKAEVPVDLRPHLSRRIDDGYGAFNSLALIDVDCGPERALWDSARLAQAALKAIKIEGLFFHGSALFQVVDRWPLPDTADEPYDVSISNLGRIDLEARYGQLELLGVHAPTFNVMMANHRILGVATCRGKLSANYTSRDPKAPDLARRGWELLRRMITLK